MTRDVLDALLRASAERRAVVLVTDLGTGASRLLDPSAAPAEGDDPVLVAAREAALRDRSCRLEAPGSPLFLRAFNPPIRVVVVGAVHITQALAPMVKAAGYDLVVVDPRRAFAAAARLPGVTVLPEWPDEAFAALGGLGRRTAVVAMTHDPKIDDPALAAALRSDAFYLGALGSRRSHAARRERLRAEGFADADLARIHGPVGLPLGAVSTGEIAVSVIAEIVAAARAAPLARRPA